MARVRTKTVKRAARKLVESHYNRFNKSFADNKRAIVDGKLAIIPTKRLRNKIAGYATRLMARLDKGQAIRGVSLKLQQEEREKRDNYVPEKSFFENNFSRCTIEAAEMLKSLGFGKFVQSKQERKQQ
uniref:Ribosomal protein S17 n=1 Tax=Trepomonas sp. PC1 TaxID=1076344 RepID=A0A146K371_9EUKA|eukprot:JAP91350.1 Ribosomal protein S17 [Trepomonas sp. PC1]